MSLLLQVSLLLAMSPVGPPPIEAVISQPETSLPRLRRFLDWVSLARPDLSPDRIRQAGADLDLDLLDLKTLEAYGVDPKQPLRLHFDGSNRCLLVELALASPKVARTRVAAVAKAKAEILGLVTIGSSALLVETGGPWALGLVIDGRRLLIQLPEPRGLSFFSPPGAARGAPLTEGPKVKAWHQHPSLIPLVILKKKTRSPTAFSVKGRPAPELVFQSRAAPDLPPSHGLVWLGDAGFELRVRWGLGLGHELAASELVPRQGGARALFDHDKLGAATELRLDLAPAAISMLGRRFGVPASATGAFTGAAHFVFASSGDVMSAFSVGARADAGVAPLLEKAISNRYPGTRARLVEQGGKKLLLVWLGSIGHDALAAALLPEPGERSESSVHLEAVPARVPAALESRSRAGDGLGLPGVQLMFFRLVLKPLLVATRSIQVDLWPRKGEAELGAKVAYQTQGVPR